MSAPTEERPRRSGLALASMICGLAGLLLCFLVVPSVVALVLGLVAARQIRASAGRMTGLAVARVGWITGLVGTLAGVAFVVAAVTGVLDDDEVSVFDLDEGDCVVVDERDDDELESLPVVDCDEPHNAEVIETGELNPGEDRPYPDDPELFGELGPMCVEAFMRYVREDARALVEPIPVAPDERAWRVGGPYVCLAVGATDSLTEGIGR